ncbi:hypothetical protein MSAN_01996200 [Mycena sanguinolenta]|uniref:Uncharacterized protein n=1 Tax=Mycena sanguinolenta TaxID=230812 RepID=A0A8H7CM58_9AGAR|nr:hypothetical protein MSAN_01996200 [Mycena sanguinolenta]
MSYDSYFFLPFSHDLLLSLFAPTTNGHGILAKYCQGWPQFFPTSTLYLCKFATLRRHADSLAPATSLASSEYGARSSHLKPPPSLLTPPSAPHCTPHRCPVNVPPALARNQRADSSQVTCRFLLAGGTCKLQQSFHVRMPYVLNSNISIPSVAVLCSEVIDLLVLPSSS